MVGTKVPFEAETAPCGRTVSGVHFLDDDGDGLLIRDERYACGCRRTHHEFHDGSIRETAVRHDHKPFRGEASEDHGC